MDQQTEERLTRVEDKLDQVLELVKAGQQAFEQFLAGPGKGLAKVFRAIGGS